ncbi:hypothetical protein ACJIZ3_023304 [Penstemon smallii]|uniref:Uncharacterized protein n=1 Tax=Penstemon smallii TaxID=265156 RepID=A0ABD3TRN5_9LAMI
MYFNFSLICILRFFRWNPIDERRIRKIFDTKMSNSFKGKIQKIYTMINMPRYWHIGNQRVLMRNPIGPRKTGHRIVVDVDK